MKLLITCIALLLLAACTNNVKKVKNRKQGLLTASIRLEANEVKRYALDDQSAPKALYSQLFKDTDGVLYFTFLNNFNNSIYFYDYYTTRFAKKITWEKKDKNGVLLLAGYYIKSLDSIYLFNRKTMEIILSNEKSNIVKRISLVGNMNSPQWEYKYPQYMPQTVMPFIEADQELLLTGFFLGTIPKSIISDFKFTTRLNFSTNKLSFSNTYPDSLYGMGYNWEGDLFTFVYSELHPDGNKLVISFPVSHNLYLADLRTGGYKKVYGGSNLAGMICSTKKRPMHSSREEIMSNIVRQDQYTAIKYDQYRKVYYRFLLKAVPGGTLHNDWKEKPIDVIVMDKKFKYLGETVIGNAEEWYWQNSFVTKEGLNIEHVEKDSDESFLKLKIFTLNKI